MPSAAAVAQPAVDNVIWHWLKGTCQKFLDRMVSPAVLFAGRAQTSRQRLETPAAVHFDEHVRRQKMAELQAQAARASINKDQ